MARDPKADWYWPLGGLSYASEIHDYFPEEAEILGAITILWTRQELALRNLFIRLLASKRRKMAEAIWDRQSTHQQRRDLLALALHTVKLTKRQRGILEWLIDRTKTLADRRNELIHAEYVVHGRTDQLHTKVKAPRSNKPPKHQRAAVSDLRKVSEDLCHLVSATEGAWKEFMTAADKRLTAQLDKLAEEHGWSQENRRVDSDLPSLRQTHSEEY